MKFVICVVLLASTVYGAPSFLDDIGQSIGSIGDKIGDAFGHLVPSKPADKTTTDIETNISPSSPKDVLSGANSKIDELKANLSMALPILDEVKNITSKILSNLKAHGPAEEIDNIINTISNNIDNTVENYLDKILDSFSNFITEHINGSSKVVNELKTCAKQFNKDVDVSLPLKDYSKCITDPLKQIEDMVISIIEAINDLDDLAKKMITDGEPCLDKFNHLISISKGATCLIDLTKSVAGKASNIVSSVTGTFMAAATYLPTLKTNAAACAIKQSTAIIQTYAANGINGTVCSIQGVVGSI